MCRAVAEDGATQPLVGKKHGGYLYNGCHEVNFEVHAAASNSSEGHVCDAHGAWRV